MKEYLMIIWDNIYYFSMKTCDSSSEPSCGDVSDEGSQQVYNQS